MARNDGIDRTVARNQDLETPADVAKVQEHNEREKDSYSNQDIVPERTALNVHFKSPTDDYVKMFEQMEQDGVISTRGLKPDAVKYGELIFDVNSAYFYNHGGYEFAKQFYADAYKAAVEIVGGEQYILSAVMHADERNQAMSEALGEDVYHYHLHVVYIPVVEKQILWSKRCKDESLRGTVKETITQVSRSKKWESKPVLDKDGNPMLNAKGKKILKSSYSVLQDDFFHFMRNAGYTDVERGERGSTEEHLTVTQFKVQAEQQRLEAVTGQVAQAKRGLENAKAATEKQKKKLEALQKETKTAKTVALTVQEIETMGKKATFGNNITLTPDECDTKELITTDDIRSKVYIIRGQQVMLDKDLAEIYGYEVKRLNEQVKRNISRFPEDFMFQLNREEIPEGFSKSQFATLNEKSNRQGSNIKKMPFAFTEQGIYMLATVLRGELAEQQSIFIMRTFREMRHYIKQNQQFVTRSEMELLSSKVTEISVQTTGLIDKQKQTDQKVNLIQKNVEQLSENFISEKDVKNFVIYKGQKLEADIAYIEIYQQAKKSIYVVDDYMNANIKLQWIMMIVTILSLFVALYSIKNGDVINEIKNLIEWIKTLIS